eukprot:scaffold284_cov127-Isochrysis_galbana.AAC.6
MPGTSQPSAAQTCNATHPTFLPVSIAEKNAVFDQLTVAEQLTIQAWMKEKEGIITDAYAKCADISCNTIAKMVMVKPPKAEVMAWMAGTGPMPPRKAQFWHFKVRSSTHILLVPFVMRQTCSAGPLAWQCRPSCAHTRSHPPPCAQAADRKADLLEVTLPLTAESTATVLRAEPWEHRPFLAWESIADDLQSPALSILEPVFAEILASVVISPELKAAAEGSDTVYPYVQFTGNGLSVPGSTPEMRKFLGTTMIIAGPEDGWTMGMFKAGPLTYVYYHDLDTDVFTVEDLVFCPGAGNPTFGSPQALLDAFNAGTLIMCGIDGEFCKPPAPPPTPPAGLPRV